MNPLESTLQARLLLLAPERLPDLRLFRRNVVVARTENRTVRAGLPGQSDLYGYVRGGRVIEVELKAAGRYLSPPQRAWAKWCSDWDVPHVTLTGRVGETVEQTVERWIGELAELIKK